MNKNERELLRRIQVALGKMAEMAPSNPCDVARKSIAADLTCPASRYLYWAIAEIGYRDYDGAESYIKSAEEIIDCRAGRIAELEKKERMRK